MKHFCQKLKYSFKEYMLIVGKTRIIRRYISALPLLLMFFVKYTLDFFPIIFVLSSFICYPFAVTLYDIVKHLILHIFFPDVFTSGYIIQDLVPYGCIIFLYPFYWLFRSLLLFLFSPLLAIILLILLSFPNISNKLHR